MRIPFAASLAGCLFMLATPASIAEEDFFAMHDPNQPYQVNHSGLDQFMEVFAEESRGRTRLAYQAMGTQGRRYLSSYIGSLSRFPVEKLNRDEQLAFWLNYHNSLVMLMLAREPRERNLEDERGTPDQPGDWWTQSISKIGDTPISLQFIEREVLAKHFADRPLFIYGLYQGVQGGPRLPVKAFRGATVDQQLEEIAKEFISRGGVRVRGKKVEHSPVYDWFTGSVFDGEMAVMEHVSMFADAKLSAKIEKAQSWQTGGFSYKVESFRPRSAAPTNGFAGFGGGGAGVGGGS